MYVVVDYRRKKVYFHFPNQEEFTFSGSEGYTPSSGDLFPTSFEIDQQWLCWFLANILEATHTGYTVSDVLVVSEFSDVFAKELPQTALRETWSLPLTWLQGHLLYPRHHTELHLMN